MSSHKRKASETITSSSSSGSSSESSVCPAVEQPIQKTTEALNTTSNSQIKVEKSTSATTPSNKKRKSGSTRNPLGDIVYVQVGPEKQKFGIHEKTITGCSPFFQRVLEEEKANVKRDPDSDYHVSSSRGIQILFLPSEEPDTFGRFNVWLYKNSILEPNENIKDTSWGDIFDIYLFALRRNVVGLQNSVVDASIEKHSKGRSLPSGSNINRLYKSDVHAASFRTLFVDLFTRGDCDIADAMTTGKYNPQFLGSLVVALDKQNKVIHNKLQKHQEKDGTKKWSQRH